MLIQIKTQDVSQGIDGSELGWSARFHGHFLENLTKWNVESHPSPMKNPGSAPARNPKKRKGSRTAKKRKKDYFWYNRSHILS